ncbi:MAG: hypothetical protein NVSMB31_12200 [Vulcanimicrobiaceae bacterium]
MARTIAVALWVGSMAGFAFIFAPAAFHAIGATPSFAATVAASLRALALFGWGCALITIAATLAVPLQPRRWNYAMLAMVVLMSALSFYEIRAIVPLMEATPLHTPAYDALHAKSSSIYSGILLLGIAVLGILSVRDVGER